MATSQIASMLDELMGRNRNLAPDDENNREAKWSDPEVCRYYLVLFCPHDLFTNTKADMGPCGKIHDDDLKAKFHDEKESYKKGQYLDEFLRFCQKSLADLQSRIKKAKERLILTQQAEEAKLNAGGGVSGGQNREVDEKIILLSEKISALVAEAEQAGCRGDVEEAQGLMKLCDQLREERDILRRTVAVSNYGNDYGTIQKAMEVCDICGAFLIVGDAQQRIDDHLLGKQHVGYARLRTAVDDVIEMRKKFREIRDKEAEERRKNKEPSKEPAEKKRSHSRDRERRDQRKRSRSRDRGQRRRSRSRDRKRDDNNRSSSSKGRSDNRRDRQQDRRRSRSRDRHRNSNSRRRSRSRDRKRDSSKSPSRGAATSS